MLALLATDAYAAQEQALAGKAQDRQRHVCNVQSQLRAEPYLLQEYDCTAVLQSDTF